MNSRIQSHHQGQDQVQLIVGLSDKNSMACKLVLFSLVSFFKNTINCKNSINILQNFYHRL